MKEKNSENSKNSDSCPLLSNIYLIFILFLYKECFTRVLKGHIALARAVFPNKTTGNMHPTTRPETKFPPVFNGHIFQFSASVLLRL